MIAFTILLFLSFSELTFIVLNSIIWIHGMNSSQHLVLPFGICIKKSLDCSPAEWVFLVEVHIRVNSLNSWPKNFFILSASQNHSFAFCWQRGDSNYLQFILISFRSRVKARFIVANKSNWYCVIKFRNHVLAIHQQWGTQWKCGIFDFTPFAKTKCGLRF